MAGTVVIGRLAISNSGGTENTWLREEVILVPASTACNWIRDPFEHIVVTCTCLSADAVC